MKKRKLKNLILTGISLSAVVLLLIKLSGPAILRGYIKTGIGTCETIPIFCKTPQEKIINPVLKENCPIKLIPSRGLPNISICVPQGFTVVVERTKKVYYKRARPKSRESIMYLLYEPPGFFTGLFPRLKQRGVRDDYEFLRRIMFAKVDDINDLTDAFFAIMKGIFIPDLGDQRSAKMAEFVMDDKRGFINYNLSGEENFFDCNVFNSQGDFFKIYMRDKGASLDLDTVFTIISTVNKAGAG